MDSKKIITIKKIISKLLFFQKALKIKKYVNKCNY
jgi:hypothetical protein